MHQVFLRAVDVDSLNVQTQYPEIPPYHPRDPDDGRLIESPNRAAGEILATEKIAGVPVRLVFLPDGYLIGTSHDWLHASGDLIANPSRGLVRLLRPLADAAPRPTVGMEVAFGVAFGGKLTPHSPQYTSQRAYGFRLTDVADVADDGALKFRSEDDLETYAAVRGWKLAPRVARFPTPDLPKSIASTAVFLAELLATSQCRLDAAAGGRPHGLVLRKPDRSWIVSLEFADYQRVKKRRNRT